MALLIADAGIVTLYVNGFMNVASLIAFLVLSFALVTYLGLVEARASHRLLAKARTEMLQEIRIVKA